eukprot:2938944-Pyramimonas_sp.AAC.1
MASCPSSSSDTGTVLGWLAGSAGPRSFGVAAASPLGTDAVVSKELRTRALPIVVSWLRPRA